MRPSRSTTAMEPPPAPISTISITGMRSGRPLPLRKRWARATSKARVVCGWASSIRQILAVVPPMSKERTRSSPHCRATWLAKTAPPTGPDSTRRMGKRIAVPMSATPPPDSMT